MSFLFYCYNSPLFEKAFHIISLKMWPEKFKLYQFFFQAKEYLRSKSVGWLDLSQTHRQLQIEHSLQVMLFISYPITLLQINLILVLYQSLNFFLSPR